MTMSRYDPYWRRVTPQQQADELLRRCREVSQNMIKTDEDGNALAVGEDLMDAFDDLDKWLADMDNPLPTAWSVAAYNNNLVNGR